MRELPLPPQWRPLIQEDDGATAVEYAIMIALIAAVCVASVRQLTTVTNDSLTQSASAISDN